VGGGRARYAGAMASDEEPAAAVEGEGEPPGERCQDDEAVDEMERESFPASDAPSTWAGRPASER
jgi:hypothetical protein